MRISDWSSDVCSSDLPARGRGGQPLLHADPSPRRAFAMGSGAPSEAAPTRRRTSGGNQDVLSEPAPADRRRYRSPPRRRHRRPAPAPSGAKRRRPDQLRGFSTPEKRNAGRAQTTSTPKETYPLTFFP